MMIFGGMHTAGIYSYAGVRVAPPRISGIARSLNDSAGKFLLGITPCITAQTLAVCRILLGVWVAYFWLINDNQLGSLGRFGARQHATKLIESHTSILSILSSDQFVASLIYWTIAALLVAFIIGLMTRILYPVLIGLFWLAALLSNQDHFPTPLLLAMTATAIVPWSERWSVDSVVKGRGNVRTPASPLYGYGIWLFGLVIGLTYTTAGLSKLVITDGGWLWETGARNGFIRDFGEAATDWGMVLSNNFILAMVASALSALGQAVYVYACFTRSALIKSGIAVFIAFPFLIGLILFMGLFWWPWAILVLILYIPWRMLDRFLARRAAMTSLEVSSLPLRHRRWFFTATVLLIVLHAYAALTNSEFEPLYSNYPMYAERMLAGSVQEADLWARLKPSGKVYRRSLQVISARGDGSTEIHDLTTPYSFAWFLQRYKLWNMDLAELNPDRVFSETSKGGSLASHCTRMQAVAAAAVGAGAQAVAFRFFKHFIDIIDGKLTWAPVTNWVEVDLSTPNCSYKYVNGMLQ